MSPEIVGGVFALAGVAVGFGLQWLKERYERQSMAKGFAELLIMEISDMLAWFEKQTYPLLTRAYDEQSARLFELLPSGCAKAVVAFYRNVTEFARLSPEREKLGALNLGSSSAMTRLEERLTDLKSTVPSTGETALRELRRVVGG